MSRQQLRKLVQRAMWSSAFSRFLPIVSLALPISWPATALAEKPDTGVSVVAQLYKDFAWQAIGGAQDIFGADLARQNKSVLQKYFDPTLSSLLVKDAKCVDRIHEICNLDFDLIFANQDPAAYDLAVEPLGQGQISVEFTPV